MSDVSQAIAELRGITRCRCDVAFTSRRLHDPDCNHDMAEEVQIVADRIEALEAENARLREAILTHLEDCRGCGKSTLFSALKGQSR